MATGLRRIIDDSDGNRRIIDIDDGRRFDTVNNRQGWFTPDEIEADRVRREQDSRRTDPRDAPAFSEEDDYDR